MSEKIMTNYKIVPEAGRGICAIGDVDGKEIQTSTIVKIKEGFIRTSSGTIYQMRSPKETLWAFQLQIKRPEYYAKLLSKNLII